jgi:NADH dehydrogenase
MFADLRKNSFRRDYPEFHGLRGYIFLVDGGSNLLAPMSDATHRDTYDTLHKMGVIIKLNTQVKDFADDKVILSTGEIIETKTLIWAAGVTAIAFEGIPKESYGRGKRMITDPFNKVTGVEDIFAIGDTCIQNHDPAYPNGHPQVAQVAIQQGKLLAKNLKAQLKGRPQVPFHYRDKGTMAIIGRNKAVADLPPKMHFRGFIAWAMWLFIHLISLINYRNRIKTLFNWMIAYFNKDQSLRFIVRPRQDELNNQ